MTAARPDGDVNVITGELGTVTHDRGRLRVRVGPLLAEVEELDGAGARGARARGLRAREHPGRHALVVVLVVAAPAALVVSVPVPVTLAGA